jgi:putative endonuclease
VAARPQPDRNALGRRAEDLVADALLADGSTLLLRNFRRRGGELDLVALDGGVLRVVEVRMRSGDDYGGGAASVDRPKQRRIVRTTLLMLQQHRELAALRVRFDVAVVTPDAPAWRIEWIRHAFEAG